MLSIWSFSFNRRKVNVLWAIVQLCPTANTRPTWDRQRHRTITITFLPEIRVMLNQLTFCVHLAVFVKRAYWPACTVWTSVRLCVCARNMWEEDQVTERNATWSHHVVLRAILSGRHGDMKLKIIRKSTPYLSYAPWLVATLIWCKHHVKVTATSNHSCKWFPTHSNLLFLINLEFMSGFTTRNVSRGDVLATVGGPC